MLRRIKHLYLDVLFELYGLLRKWFVGIAHYKQKEFDYWISKAEVCIDKRSDILEKMY